ncbi:MAG: (R,R)-butanediol dehydrogenase/meso-butanediol dehydrogenase/diacetyl reductase [Candidatus Aldehydirespiratoraceae bacterium]|jgi:(R,R)-butanediol dehydrogenase/meso-butanediol dehydrogenase/diacetyl reductase
MHVALITGLRQVEIVEFPTPTPSLDGVVVDVALCGICGTDLHAYTGGREYNPAICGHEWTGVVSAKGNGVSRFTEGDRVVVGVPPACGACNACRAGHHAHCSTAFSFAVGRDEQAPAHGGFAPQIAVHQDRVIHAHADLNDEALAQVEPFTVSFHAVARSGIREGDLAVIQGAGPVGLMTMQCAAAAGAGEIIVIEPGESRRALASTLGATHVVHPDQAEEFILNRSNGLGADIVYECVGAAATLQAAVDLARRGGTMCLIGLAHGDVPINPRRWLGKEITVTSALAYLHDDFLQTMELVASGAFRVETMHTATTRLDGLAATLEDLASGNTSQTKVLLNPNWA